MKYIRSCEHCFREIRFPIDKGTLFVTCPYCNNSFKVNPDDPSLYSTGRFDVLKINQNQPEEFFFGRNFNPPIKSSEKSKSIIKLVIIFFYFPCSFFILIKFQIFPILLKITKNLCPRKNFQKKLLILKFKFA